LVETGYRIQVAEHEDAVFFYVVDRGDEGLASRGEKKFVERRHAAIVAGDVFPCLFWRLSHGI